MGALVWSMHGSSAAGGGLLVLSFGLLSYIGMKLGCGGRAGWGDCSTWWGGASELARSDRRRDPLAMVNIEAVMASCMLTVWCSRGRYQRGVYFGSIFGVGKVAVGRAEDREHLVCNKELCGSGLYLSCVWSWFSVGLDRLWWWWHQGCMGGLGKH